MKISVTIAALLLCTVALLASRSVCEAGETAASAAETYYLSRSVDLSFEEAVARVREELPKEGFAILTEIDMAARFKEKLDVDMPPYLILGACSSKDAHAAWTLEEHIGAIMPCNVVVRVTGDGATEVFIRNPRGIAAGTGNAGLEALGEAVHVKVSRVLAAL